MFVGNSPWTSHRRRFRNFRQVTRLQQPRASGIDGRPSTAEAFSGQAANRTLAIGGDLLHFTISTLVVIASGSCAAGNDCGEQRGGDLLRRQRRKASVSVSI
ncbi:hypothetical protein ACNKHU_13860 [Shigella flexneri]